MKQKATNWKRYLGAVNRRLHMPKRYRMRVISDLESSIAARREAGQSDSEILQALGTPKEAARELNAQMFPHTWRKSPWRFASLALAVFGALVLLFEGLWPVALLSASASLGIIGGADGPTAIFITTAQSQVNYELLLGAALLVLGLVGYILLRHCTRKEERERED